jgi:hypothetical protein
MSAWLKRFGLHLAAAVGATGIFVAAAAVGASQTRQQVPTLPAASVVARPNRTPRPTLEPTPAAQTSAATPASVPQQPARTAVRPERSLAGTIREIQADGLSFTIQGVGGRTWRIEPEPGALIRLNGKAAKLDALQPGDTVVILGQAQPGPGARFLAHAITAKSR